MHITDLDVDLRKRNQTYLAIARHAVELRAELPHCTLTAPQLQTLSEL